MNDADLVSLPGQVSPLAKPQFDAGLADPQARMERMILMLSLRPGGEEDLNSLIAQQHDPASPLCHQWLTPDQFGTLFGVSDDDVNLVVSWLQQQGFSVDEVARGRRWINFTGTVGQVERAFHTEIHQYFVNGELHHANATPPQIPRALSGTVLGFASLHDFYKKPMHGEVKFVSPDWTSGAGNHYLGPGDFATIYNVNPLYTANPVIDGTGKSVAVVARSNINHSDPTTFRSFFKLPAKSPNYILNGNDPGLVGGVLGGEVTEADLDVQWAGAIAYNATVNMVISKSTMTTDGVDLSAQYIVNNNVAPIMTTSFGLCEQDLGSDNTFYSNLWAQAVSQGITPFVSAGDSGAAGCDSGNSSTGTIRAVNGLCSPVSSVCVGGTLFMDTSNPSLYWSASNSSTTNSSALSYIPEQVWNESGSVSGGSGLWSTGGGASTLYSKPAYQFAPGVPADSVRDVPDVSLSAASHDGYLIYQNGNLYSVGGTSASSPSFASLLALVLQKTGSAQGNANTVFYPMGNNQYAGSGPVAFHDITIGNNTVPGVTGYNATTGFDLATGLGSVNVNTLVNNWGIPDFAVAVPATASASPGSSVPVTVTTTVANGFSAPVSLSASGLPSGVSAGFNPATVAAPGAGTSTLTLTAASNTTPGTYPISVTATGEGKSHSASLSLTVAASQPTTVSVSPNSGSGTTQTFTVVYSDGAGYQKITATQVTFNHLLQNTGGCPIYYDAPTNGFYLWLDNGTSAGPATPGQAVTLSNNQCSLNAATSSVNGSGNNLTITLALTFSSTFTGTQNIYTLVKDSLGQTSGWQTMGTWTPVASGPPAVVSVTPSSGAGTSQTFSLVYSDGAGYQKITATQVIFNQALQNVGGCPVYYDATANAFYLWLDNGTAAGPATPGQAVTLQNNQCSLNVGASSVSGSGNNLTINVALTFSGTFAGTQNIYMLVKDSLSQTSGWQQKGTWTTSALSPPAAVSVTPSSGSGTSQSFSLVYSDGAGYQKITATQVIFNQLLQNVGGCPIYYDATANAFYLWLDNGTAAGPATPGQAVTLQNNQCSLNVGSSSVSGSGNNLTLTLALTFSNTFTGTQNIYMLVKDSLGQTSGWQQKGTWTTASPSPPSVVSVTPSSGTGLSQTFAFVYADTAGYQKITATQVIFNQALQNVGGCPIYYDATANALYLWLDNGTAAGPATPGQAITLQNNQCSLSVGASSVSGSGNNLTLNLALTFSGSFSGTQNIYMLVKDNLGQTSGWQQMGTWVP